MSIHIRVYPQPGSIGYARTNRRRAAMQNMQAQRNLQLQTLRLQHELRTQQQTWAPGTVGQGAFGYNTGIAGGLPGFGGVYGRGYQSPVQVGYGYPGAAGYGSAMQGGYGCQPGSIGQFNSVNQYGGYGSVTNANSYGSYGSAYAPAYGSAYGTVGYPVGYANVGYGAGLLGGLGSIGASIGNMFTSAFRGW